jgi:hypothetical protein
MKTHPNEEGELIFEKTAAFRIITSFEVCPQ